MRPDLSVIVVSCSRADELSICMADLSRQKTKYAFDVVLVLQAYPSDFVGQLAQRFAGSVPLRVLDFPQALGIHAARNAGLRVAEGDIVAFVDDDCRIRPDWVEALLPYYEDTTIGGVGGYVCHPGRATWWRRMAYPLLGLCSRRYLIDWGGFSSAPGFDLPSTVQEADWLSGCNMSFRLSAMEQVGYFDETYGKYGFDDVDYGLRVRHAGWRLTASPLLTNEHYPSLVNRQGMYSQVCEQEQRRVLLVRKAIGMKPLWQFRYAVRFCVHLIAMTLLGIVKRDWRIPVFALKGAYAGLRQWG
jgi:GT2 family glycosyltransferase